MKMPEPLTPWYPDSTEPVRDGVYEVRFLVQGRRLYSRWFDGFWRSNSPSKKTAATKTEHSFHATAMRGTMQWRGVTAPQSMKEAL